MLSSGAAKVWSAPADACCPRRAGPRWLVPNCTAPPPVTATSRRLVLPADADRLPRAPAAAPGKELNKTLRMNRLIHGNRRLSQAVGLSQSVAASINTLNRAMHTSRTSSTLAGSAALPPGGCSTLMPRVTVPCEASSRVVFGLRGRGVAAGTPGGSARTSAGNAGVAAAQGRTHMQLHHAVPRLGSKQRLLAQRQRDSQRVAGNPALWRCREGGWREGGGGEAGGCPWPCGRKEARWPDAPPAGAAQRGTPPSPHLPTAHPAAGPARKRCSWPSQQPSTALFLWAWPARHPPTPSPARAAPCTPS